MSSVRVKCKAEVTTPRGASTVTHTVEVPAEVGSEMDARNSARQSIAESYRVPCDQVKLLSFDVVNTPPVHQRPVPGPGSSTSLEEERRALEAEREALTEERKALDADRAAFEQLANEQKPATEQPVTEQPAASGQQPGKKSK